MSETPRNLLVCGTRTLAEEVADLAAESPGFRVTGFVENVDRERCASPLRGLPVIWYEDLPRLAADHCAVVALATTRRNLFTELVDAIRAVQLLPVPAHDLADQADVQVVKPRLEGEAADGDRAAQQGVQGGRARDAARRQAVPHLHLEEHHQAAFTPALVVARSPVPQRTA